ncbi:SgcJ/EcaC family oxidoreductase [Thalassotalea euphylliae]|uniref:SgcJ/EcaC family oxidoreductase n=1 Tax=Thalassotalea euphylliae TaxID=1655234 RepID=UPI00364367E9
MNEFDVVSLFDKWNIALQTKDAKQVTALYASDAILLPTVSNQVRHNHAEIEDYFVSFIQREPMGKLDESNIRVLGEIVIHSGVYTFSLKDNVSVTARFTFVYQLNGGAWEIIEHHSSQLPEFAIG